MTGKASDMCPKCKNCEGLDKLTKMYSCKHYNNYLDADSGICCLMFEEKKEKESFNLNMPREQLEAKILDLFEEKNRLNGIINRLEKEKAAHLKGIERLKKSQEKLQNQVRNLQTTNEESYKREEKLEGKVHKLERRLLEENKRFDRLDTEFLIPLAHVLYPREAKICKPYSEVLEDIKLLNNRVFMLEADNIRLTEKNNALFEENLNRLDKHTKQCQEIDNLRNELASLKTINKGLAKDIEIKSLQDKYEAAMTGWKDAIDTNDKMIGEKDKQIEELARRYNMIAKKLNDIHDILKEDPNNA